MKMQTTIHAPMDGAVKEIAVKARQAVEARDLLVTIE
jgi:biotin carboxyl carrier protein